MIVSIRSIVLTSLFSLVLFSKHFLAKSFSEQLKIGHPKFEKPLIFNVTLPSGYRENKDKSYVLLFDFHPLANTFLSGLHDWMSHNGEWPWLQTIIVTPALGNPVGLLFDDTGETTPLLHFFEKRLIP